MACCVSEVIPLKQRTRQGQSPGPTLSKSNYRRTDLDTGPASEMLSFAGPVLCPMEVRR